VQLAALELEETMLPVSAAATPNSARLSTLHTLANDVDVPESPLLVRAGTPTNVTAETQ
jgi:hypothetical protein